MVIGILHYIPQLLSKIPRIQPFLVSISKASYGYYFQFFSCGQLSSALLRLFVSDPSQKFRVLQSFISLYIASGNYSRLTHLAPTSG
jgi:hypothetical protein